MLDSFAPFIPGDVGNAHTFPFPVRYETVKGLNASNMVNWDDSHYPNFLEAGLKLTQSGVKAITGDCGYMAIFQDRLAKDLQVPVFLSSLLQLHFLTHLVHGDEKIAVITADSTLLTNSLLASINIDHTYPIVIQGLQNQPYFKDFALTESGVLDTNKVEQEVVNATVNLVQKNPSISIILLECSMLPPYAKAIQEAVSLPVFDYTSMIEYVYNAYIRKKFDFQ
ncbi:aspartate/glutamate racemase family protein [Salinibacillus xinjiangensis]|uniref:Aspartate/glutamate racemase family protein n=2 Tax=Salinibacillus xinjiangensis TaxID=1229268 RepID=A0A6G1X4I5_9BACI|nr:aspartate/glutamate racemase family protein [Salinibacillus xinjiangensis]